MPTAVEAASDDAAVIGVESGGDRGGVAVVARTVRMKRGEGRFVVRIVAQGTDLYEAVLCQILCQSVQQNVVCLKRPACANAESHRCRCLHAIYAMLTCSTVRTQGMMRIFLLLVAGASTTPHGNLADSSHNWKRMDRT